MPLTTNPPHPGHILVPDPRLYGEGKDYKNPMDELKEFEPGMHWNWTWGTTFKNDETPRPLLFSWENSVFGEGMATVTRKIAREYREGYKFAFVLSDYRTFKPIPFSQLQLGTRLRHHRSLIRLDAKVWKAFQAARRGKATNAEAASVSESAQIEADVESLVNPQKNRRQGFGLTAKEKKCVERHAMDRAMAYLVDVGFDDVDDVSDGNPFDILATRKGKTLNVEVKGTTGRGAEILLTKNEVQFQQMSHPANMLIVVHSITLKRGIDPKASGGKLHKVTPWRLDDEKLKPYAYAYQI